MTGQIQGTTHLCQGQEAVSVGADRGDAAGRRPDEHVPRPRRGAGPRAWTPETAFAELMGRPTGGSGGVGGSMHLIDFSKGNIGANAIVGAGLPIAVGAAVAFQMQRKPNVALTFFGDGATNIGTFHEALNMAAVWKAPVVFIITNNLYGEYSPLRTTTPIDDLARRADPYGMPGHHRRRPGHRRRPRRDGRGRRAGPSRRRPQPPRDEDLPLSRPQPERPGEVPARTASSMPGRRATRSSSSAPSSSRTASSDRTTRSRSATETQAEIDAAAERAAAAPYPTLEETRPYVYAD